MNIVQQSEWNSFIAGHPEAHVLQSDTWGELKRTFGWDVERVIVGNTGTLVLFKRLPLGLSIGYIPKGPLGCDWKVIWGEVNNLCMRHHAVFLKVEPDLRQFDEDNVNNRLDGFIRSNHTIQPRNTIVVNLSGSEEDWLMRMKQKTRYNIRLAQKKGVRVRPSDDLDSFYAMVQVTADRDRFGVHTSRYYQLVYELFQSEGNCELLIAQYGDAPLAALILLAQGKRAYYFYGASNNLERNRMPTYLLQWEAMRWAARKGCIEYDLWGIPDEKEEVLEKYFMQRSDGLWGVYRFKRGFGGEIKRSIGAWDRIYHPGLYKLYLLYEKVRKKNLF
ncbi:MAG TPA: peptidoglycan bridge formation glycyltransferase FemA/FemB family protein [Anaerolineae bacterium]|nr:peptidoglycan bridge formation glycyltransferase FemA/FemB family protein [Anaerolineae bacterium]